MEKILIVAAHPDDEAIGCGGTIAKFAGSGCEIHALFLTDGVGARMESTSVDTALRNESTEKAAQLMGIQSIEYGTFPDNQVDSLPLLKVVQFVEQHLNVIKPDTVITHHAFDLNVDHQIAHRAVMTACRPQPGFCVKTILNFEVASSTEWQTPHANQCFTPNWFVDISEQLDTKKQALMAYEQELHGWPHSRSIEAIEHMARWRGASMGCEAAEAFMLVRNLS